MKFEDWAPLGEVIKHIKLVARDRDYPSGIPIYVDPDGLAEADKTLESRVTIDLEGIPIGVSLKLLVRQLGLTYQVRNGIVVITGPVILARTDDSTILDFRRVGHCHITLMAALVGGIVGRFMQKRSKYSG